MQTIKNNSTYFKKYYRILGNSLDDNNISTRLYILVIVLFYAAVRVTYSIFNKWHNLDQRNSSIEESVTVFMGGLFLAELLFYTPRVSIPLNFIEGAFYKHYRLSNDLIEIKNKGHKKAMLFHYGLVFGFVSYCISYTVAPWIEAIQLINSSTEEMVNFEEIFMPLPSVSFFTTTDIRYFALECTWQAIFLIFLMTVICFWSSLLTTSSVHLATEIRIISTLINKMEETLQIPIDSFCKIFPKEYEEKLQNWVVSIVEHHLAIIRAVKDQNKAFTVSLLFVNHIVAVHFAMVLYCGLALEGTFSKWRYMYAVIATMITMGIISWPGQEIINECSELHRSVCEIQWYNKPEWFKHELKIIIMLTRRPLTLSPAGLYVLNLKSFLNMLQVAYSYANVMLTMKFGKN